jgi:ribose 5-phosphate isomerase B
VIFVGSDHAGCDLKTIVQHHLLDRGCEVSDLGVECGARGDYPVLASRVGHAVISSSGSLGLVFCGSGVGVSIAANKIPGIRCVVCTEPYSALMARRHNNANVLALGQRVVGSGLAVLIVDTFLGAEFEQGRHTHRLSLIAEIERGREL